MQVTEKAFQTAARQLQQRLASGTFEEMELESLREGSRYTECVSYCTSCTLSAVSKALHHAQCQAQAAACLSGHSCAALQQGS